MKNILNKEWRIITLAWLLIYASTPLYMLYTELVAQESFLWSGVLNEWSYTSVFLIVFLVNHFLLIPKLISKKHTTWYVLSVLACIACFILYLHYIAPQNPQRVFIDENPHRNEMVQNEPHDDGGHRNRHVGRRRHRDVNIDMARPTPHKDGVDNRPMHDRKRHKRFHSPFLLAPPDLARLITMILMVLADLGAVAWLNEQKLRERLLSLEQQNLKQELAHLRYQINPHFFMNTLNNIHALIDIDQERAKRAIVELSGMMRYALYEGNNSLTPLQQEIEFLRMYISLMRLRYSNKVDVHVDMPEKVPTELMMPPMLFATFIENAFKHGVSYQKPSYIYIKLNLEDSNHTVRFCCINSRHHTVPHHQDDHHGIGLANVRKRLDLQYVDKYALNIDEQDMERYTVNLTIPSKPSITNYD